MQGVECKPEWLTSVVARLGTVFPRFATGIVLDVTDRSQGVCVTYQNDGACGVFRNQCLWISICDCLAASARNYSYWGRHAGFQAWKRAFALQGGDPSQPGGDPQLMVDVVTYLRYLAVQAPPTSSGRAQGSANAPTEGFDNGIAQGRGLDNVCHSLGVRLRVYEMQGPSTSMDFGPAHAPFVHVLHISRGRGHFEAIDLRFTPIGAFRDERRNIRRLASDVYARR